MAYEMSEYLTPPVLCRAQTDPTSTYESRRPQPASPPPTYDEVMKEVLIRIKLILILGAIQIIGWVEGQQIVTWTFLPF